MEWIFNLKPADVIESGKKRLDLIPPPARKRLVALQLQAGVCVMVPVWLTGARKEDPPERRGHIRDKELAFFWKVGHVESSFVSLSLASLESGRFVRCQKNAKTPKCKDTKWNDCQWTGPGDRRSVAAQLSITPW